MKLLTAILCGFLAPFGLCDSGTMADACCDVQGDND